MTKNELIAELQKIDGNPQISIGINTSWGKLSYSVTGITPLFQHDNHKVDSSPCILEINCEDKTKLGQDQLDMLNREYLIKKYGPLSICNINERFWAVNGYWLNKWNQEKIELLEQKINNLQNKK